jgi:hypothetical protein
MKKDKRGGSRPGSGRPKKDTVGIHVRIDQAAYSILQEVEKKGEYISEAIKNIWGNE